MGSAVTGIVVASLGIALCSSSFVAVEADGPSMREFALSNGVRVLSAHVADAPMQSIFVFIPLHLGNDDPGRAQWSHLLEHHLIRSTDPLDLFPDGFLINGETTEHALRLDMTFDPERLDAALDRLEHWLTARRFEEDVHEREQANIRDEEQAVAMSGYTHKFALAAWNQIVRHGLAHAAVHGDVADALLEEVHEYAAQRLPRDGRVLIAAIGPVDLDELRDGIVERLDGLARVEAASAVPDRDGFDGRGEFAGTWDLPVAHVMRWWMLPDEEPETMLAAILFGQTATARFFQRARDDRNVRFVLAQPIVATPEGRYFIVNASLAPDGDPAAALELIDETMSGLLDPEGPTIGHVRMMLMAPPWASDPRFEVQRRRVPESHRHLIEANWMLQLAMLVDRVGGDLTALRAAGEAVRDAQRVRDWLAALREAPGGTLTFKGVERE